MSSGHILTLNAGSSSLKYALFERSRDSARSSGSECSPALPDGTLARTLSGKVERIGSQAPDHARALETVLGEIEARAGLGSVDAVGHRIVYGGEAFQASTSITAGVVSELRRLCELDPDHLPAEIAIIEAFRARSPSTPQVACFDTAFHRTLPRVARLLPIPRRYEASGVRRYGFHGISYQFLSEELARVAGDGVARGRVVMAHLGSGSSLAATYEGRCIDTTMGFTPNSGVPMGTRCGDLEPGVVIHLLRSERLGADDLDEILSHRSGLIGISETSSDMRDLLARESSDARAADAVALFCYQVRKSIGSLAAALGGLEVLVFAGGIGENAPEVRARIARGLEHLGVRLDEARNASSSPLVSSDASACSVRVIRTDEEAVIARDTARVLSTAC
jgi:acetate kinase